MTFQIKWSCLATCLLGLLFLGMPHSGKATVLDSLEAELLQHTQPDSQRVLNLLRVAGLTYGTDPTRASQMCEEALAISQKDSLVGGQINSYYLLAVLALFRSECDSVNRLLDTIDVLLEVRSIPLFPLKSYNLRAICYDQAGDFEKTIYYNFLALQEARNGEMPQSEGAILTNLGNAYRRLGDFPNALQYYSEAQLTTEKIGDFQTLGAVHNNLGDILVEQGKPDSALYHFRKSYHYKVSTNYLLNVSTSYLGMAQAYRELDQSDSAEYYFRKALGQSQQFNNVSSEFEIRTAYGTYLLKQNRLEEAEEMIRPTFRMEGDAQIPKTLIKGYQTLARLKAEQGNYELAYAYQRTYSERRDTLFSFEVAAQAAQYESGRKSLEIARLEASEAKNRATIDRQNLWLVGGVAVAVILLILITVVLYIYWRSRRVNALLTSKTEIISQQNEALRQRNDQLEVLGREKDGLIGVVAHDLKAPLNSSLALIELAEQSPPTAAAQQSYLDMMRKVNSRGLQLISDILRLHQAEGQEEEYPARERDLVSEFSAMLQGFDKAAERKSISFRHPDIPTGRMAKLPWTPVHRIVENLVSNAIKFSAAGTQMGVAVHLTGDSLEIQVSDEGPGISEADQQKMFRKFQKLSAQPTGGEHSSGLGLAIVKTLVDQLNGTVGVESELGKGTVFRVKLPLG